MPEVHAKFRDWAAGGLSSSATEELLDRLEDLPNPAPTDIRPKAAAEL